MPSEPKTGYTPKWETDKGDVIVFPASNTLFDTLAGAVEWRLDQFLFMIPFGLKSSGILEFEHKDGKFELPHVPVTVGKLGPGIVIEGPIFDEATAKQESDDAE